MEGLFSISETNEQNPSFAKLPLTDKINIINAVWSIDFDEEDDYKLKHGTLQEKTTIRLWRLLGKNIAYFDIEAFVEIIFMFAPFIIFSMILIVLSSIKF